MRSLNDVSSVNWIKADWPAPAGIIAGCTTRAGGVSAGRYAALNLGDHVGDAPAKVAENRRRLVAALELPAEPCWLEQVHGNRVIDADPASVATADGVVSRDGRDVLGIMTADCLPVLLCSEASLEIAALHCGWRSLAAGIIPRAVERLESPPSALLAWLGPAISQPAFEVGDDVRDVFLSGIHGASACFEPNERGRWQADLYALARLYLADAGVGAVYGGGHCTYSDDRRFFSYRRDGETGRMASVITRTREGAV